MPLLIAFAVSVTSGALLASAFHAWHGESLAQWEGRVQRGLSELRAQVETELYSNIHLGTRLAAVAASDTEISAAEFATAAQDLLDFDSLAVRYFAFAPEHVIRHVHPSAGNRILVGKRLSEDPFYARILPELRRTRQLLVSGPVEPVTGGRALVVSEPLFGPDAQLDAPPLIGQIIMLIDLEQFYRRADIYRIAENLDIAIRVADLPDDPGAMLFGREAVFSSAPLVTQVALPGMKLKLAALPHGGWGAVAPVPIFMLLLAPVLLALIFFASYRLVRQAQRLRHSEAHMRRTGERLSTLLAAMPNLVAIIDRDGRIEDIFGGNNPASLRIDLRSLVNRRLDEILPQPKAQTLLGAMRRARRENSAQTIEYNISDEDARIFSEQATAVGEQWFRSVVAPLHEGAQEVSKTLWITDNITAARQTEFALLRSHNRYRQLTNAVQQVVFETDHRGLINFINRAGEQLGGRAADSLVGRPWTELIHPDDRDELIAAFNELMNGHRSKVQQDARLAASGDGEFWVNTCLIPLAVGSDAVACGAIGTLFDINERKRNESEIRHQALHDALTGLPNRLLLIERLDHALTRMRRQGTELAVLFVDLDRFKDVNDHHGHLAGDQVLQQVALRLRGQLRDTDTVARIGGDEFIVLLDPVTEREGIDIVANKLSSAMTRPIEITLNGETVSCRVGASIGVALAPRDGTTVDALLHEADCELYRVKATVRSASHPGAE